MEFVQSVTALRASISGTTAQQAVQSTTSRTEPFHKRSWSDGENTVNVYTETDELIATKSEEGCLPSESADHTTTQWIGRGIVNVSAQQESPLHVTHSTSRQLHKTAQHQLHKVGALLLCHRGLSCTRVGRDKDTPRHTRAHHDEKAAGGSSAPHAHGTSGKHTRECQHF